ncbi:MAG: hypothetical protein J7L47_08410 [Candidatus Odinarchaeota archaeon]|nr:hypothetical protein [Candidatus Odinarchaeota archaeon]
MPTKKSKKTRRRKKRKEPKIFRRFIFYLLFTLAWSPIVLSFLVSANVLSSDVIGVNADYSIYNTDLFGLSQYKADIESMGYTVKPLFSSLSALSKLDQDLVLMIVGPSKGYDITDMLTVVNLLLNGSSVLISDDTGSANTLLSYFSMFGLNISFGPGILMEYYSNYHNSPAFPIIRTFVRSPVTQGINEIILNYATFINGTVPPLALSSPFSWVDLDNDSLPTLGLEKPGPYIVASAIDLSMLVPGAGKLFLFSDPSLFTNIMLPFGDNRRFALNIINWLADNGKKNLIVFDEGHLALPVGIVQVYSVIMTYATFLSSNWLLAPIYPIVAIYVARKWLPKGKKAAPLNPTKVFRRRGESEFSELLKRYKRQDAYPHVLNILYKKWKRDLKRALNISGLVPLDTLYTQILNSGIVVDSKALKHILESLEKKKYKHIDKEEFTKIFFFMENLITQLKR